MDLEAVWEEFMESGNIQNDKFENKSTDTQAPKASDLYISTKSKIIYMNNSIDLVDIFWKLDILPYDKHDEGIIKKQIKVISESEKELQNTQNLLSKYKYYSQFVISHLDQHQADTNIYKDIRKISIGISQKDLLSYRSKQKSAFYNCFVIIIRLKDDKNCFKEIHIKVFNTGKIEIPGVQNDQMFERACTFITNILNKYSSKEYQVMKEKTEIILINSNFHCGFCINRQNLFNILRRKYNLNVSYDPCSYPGIQCKYNVDNHRISFMIFRTGSILVVGKCEDSTINKVYEYLKTILHDEYKEICENYDNTSKLKEKEKPKKTRKKIIYVDVPSDT